MTNHSWLDRLTITIPAHNEADNIGGLVCRASQYGEVCVVDDGSTDRTAELAAAAGARVLRNPAGSQYGDGFIAGLQEAQSGPGIFMDAGGSHAPEDIPRLLAGLREADVVIGSRLVSGARQWQSRRRRLLTRIGIWLFAAVSLSTPMDYSGFRAFNATAVDWLR